MCKILKLVNFKEIPVDCNSYTTNKLIRETNDFLDSNIEFNEVELDYHEKRLKYLALICINRAIPKPKKIKPKLKLIKKAA